MTTARKIAYEISNGMRPEQFIGNKTKEVLAQELFSLKNRYTPETMTAFEKTEFENDLNRTVAGIITLPRKQQINLFKTVDNMLNHRDNDDAQQDNLYKTVDNMLNQSK